MCTNFFVNRLFLDVQLSVLESAESFQENIQGLYATRLLNGNSTRLASYILQELKTGAAEAVQAVKTSKDEQGIKNTIAFIHKLDFILRAAVENKTAQDAQVLETFRSKMLERDVATVFERRKELAEEILGERLPDTIIKYFIQTSENLAVPYVRVLEKYIQLNYKLKKMETYDIDIVMRAILTNFSVQSGNANQIALIYSLAQYRVQKNYGKIPHSLKITLILKYMNAKLDIKVPELYDLYMQLSALTKASQVLALPKPEVN